MKKVTVIVGGQYGSEAKGKVVGFLSDRYDIAVRTGSPNAGHTVVNDGKKYILQQIPAAFLNSKCRLCIGAGALIDPEILKREIELTVSMERLCIDPQAGILEKKHADQEKNGEIIKNIGSTGKGCGAALIDRMWRKDFMLAKDYFKGDNEIAGLQMNDISEIVNKGIDEGKSILVEGTQGFGLSLYHGSYPFTTSRDTTAANFLAEAGISPLVVKDIILVIRTFPIRVAGNSGPLKSEISWPELSRRIGKEVEETTTVTKRIRRVAEFDIELVQKAIMINRPTKIALCFLDYLFPEDEDKNKWDDLSKPAQDYILNLEKELGVPITLIGTGADNKAMVER